MMCFPLGMVYFLVSPRSGVTTISLLPFDSLPKETMPSISVTIALSFGRRASKSSATRGRPPVMSFVFVVSRGIFDTMSPAWMSSPSFTTMWAPMGSMYRAGLAVPGMMMVLPLSSLMEMRGRRSGSRASMTTL